MPKSSASDAPAIKKPASGRLRLAGRGGGVAAVAVTASVACFPAAFSVSCSVI